MFRLRDVNLCVCVAIRWLSKVYRDDYFSADFFFAYLLLIFVSLKKKRARGDW